MGMLWVLMQRQESCQFLGDEKLVFVGAFSEFGGCVYRIPAPILGGFGGKLSEKHQRGVGVR
jgi:hypothetical protein